MASSKTKVCGICSAEVSQFKPSPTTCVTTLEDGQLKYGHTETERACAECWEAHISCEVEEKRADAIECMFCHSNLSAEQIKKLARQATVQRYEARLQNTTTYRCQARCPQTRLLDPDGTPSRHPLHEGHAYRFLPQPHDPATAGRIFTCHFCSFATCTTCDRPAHPTETCAAHQHRLGLLRAPPKVEGKIDNRSVQTCPSCASYFVILRGCGFVACTACRYRFCQRCLIPWVGEGSACLVGPEAHGSAGEGGKGCRYREWGTPSGHALKGRFVVMGGKKGREGGKRRREVDGKVAVEEEEEGLGKNGKRARGGG